MSDQAKARELLTRGDFTRGRSCVDGQAMAALDVLERFLLLMAWARDGGPMRCGDVVRLRHYARTCVVAYADYEMGTLATAGEDGFVVRIADCTLRERVSDAGHAEDVALWLEADASDFRAFKVRQLYGRAAAEEGTWR